VFISIIIPWSPWTAVTSELKEAKATRSKNNLHNRVCSKLCSSRKYLYHPSPRKVNKNPMGRGIPKANFFKGRLKLNCKFQRGGVSKQKPLVANIFSATTHCRYKEWPKFG